MAKIDKIEQAVNKFQLNMLKVQWWSHTDVHPNTYNPNRMTDADRRLLRQSLLEDGWTQPLVILPDGTIVDGEQRWTVACLPIRSEIITTLLSSIEKREVAGHEFSPVVKQRLEIALSIIRLLFSREGGARTFRTYVLIF